MDRAQVELIRFRLERVLDDELCGHPALRDVCRRASTASRRDRRQRLANSLLLTEELAPRVHALARRAQDTLGVDGPFELYQTRGQSPDEVNACVGAFELPMRIELLGSVVTNLEPDSIVAVIGHELGHFLAHGPSSPLALHPYVAFVERERAGDPRVARLAVAYCQAAELTADRFGLLACRNLEAALRTELVSVAGVPAHALDCNIEAYVAQCRKLMLATLRSARRAWGTSHPEHNLRAYALWLFSETHEYRAIIGEGGGTRTLADVDLLLSKLLLGVESVGEVPARSKKKRVKRRRKKVNAKQEPPAAEAEQRELRQILGKVAEQCGESLREIANEMRTLMGPRKRRSLVKRARVEEVDADPLAERFEELERRLVIASTPAAPTELERRFEELEELARKGQLRATRS